jgi:hypothetical protein
MSQTGDQVDPFDIVESSKALPAYQMSFSFDQSFKSQW